MLEWGGEGGGWDLWDEWDQWDEWDFHTGEVRGRFGYGCFWVGSGVGGAEVGWGLCDAACGRGVAGGDSGVEPGG